MGVYDSGTAQVYVNGNGRVAGMTQFGKADSEPEEMDADFGAANVLNGHVML